MAASVVVPLIVSGAPALADTPSTGGLFVPSQVRVLDTRAATTVGGYTTMMPANTWRTVTVAGMGDLPASGIAAVVVNFRVSQPTVAGVLNADADGVSSPNTSVAYVAYNTGPTQSNAGVIPVGSDGNIQVRTTSTTHLIIDVQGYYTAGSTSAGGYVPLTPARLMDTTTGVGVAQGQLAAGSVTPLDAGGTAGIPADASALMLNITVKNQTSSGYLTAYPVDESKPQVSSNYQAITDSIGLQVGLGTNSAHTAAFKIYTSVAADMVVDVVGYFTSGSSSGSAFTPYTAVAYDTRVSPHTAIAANAAADVTIAGAVGLPPTSAGISAIAADLTVIHQGANAGTVDAWNSDDDEPTGTPTLNYAAASSGTTTNNFAIIPVGFSGTVRIHNIGPDPIDVVLNVEGWYADPDTSAGDSDDGALQTDPTDGDVITGTDVIESDLSASTIASTGPVGSDGMQTVVLADGTHLTMSSAAVTQAQNTRAAYLANPSAEPDSGGGSTSVGNCGSSFINIIYRSDGTPAQMVTAWHVTGHRGVYYHWAVGFSGPKYNYIYNASGSLNLRWDWKGSHSSHKAYPHGSWAAGVFKGASWVLRADGSICFSGGPYVHHRL